MRGPKPLAEIWNLAIFNASSLGCTAAIRHKGLCWLVGESGTPAAFGSLLLCACRLFSPSETELFGRRRRHPLGLHNMPLHATCVLPPFIFLIINNTFISTGKKLNYNKRI